MVSSNNDFRTLIGGIEYNQFGKKVLATQLRFSTLEAVFEVDSEVQRRLDPQRRSEIREYIIRALKEKDFYFSPFVFSARGAIEKTEQGWSLAPGSKLYILDGQHRASAMASALSHLKSQKETAEEWGSQIEASKIQVYIDNLRAYPVAMQVYLELSQKEERQLFTDINTERKEAHIGLIMQYDHRDAYSELTRNVANLLQDQFEIEQKLSRLTKQNSAVTSLPIIRRCLIALFEGILTVKKGDPNFRYFTSREVLTISQSFFEVWLELFPRKMANRKCYVSGLTGIQIALAYAVYHLTKNYSITHLEAIHHLKVLKRHCSWKHDDPLFSQLYDPTTRKIKNHSSTTAIGKLAMIFVEIIEKERMVVLDR
ncbi:DNA sulfur modification protein DndB [Neobacillus drentensis]|uniref:DNA sulfur modification protein DndB n=1 Tax=Neobacillus drentensis TaxID=220684 RepID=UPI00285CBA0F|nr:DNA sulfur modification protein DndB [Neobacillus drentensis]MDR7240501.1 DNA sulfur modification protein DndB [Neobacillus drentensis]